jgi:hypothetical protein
MNSDPYAAAPSAFAVHPRTSADLDGGGPDRWKFQHGTTSMRLWSLHNSALVSGIISDAWVPGLSSLRSLFSHYRPGCFAEVYL